MGTTTKYILIEKIGRALRRPDLVYRSLIRRWRIVKRVSDACMMMALLQVWPEQVYRFSTRKVLPSKRERYPISERKVIPCDVIDSRTSNDLPHFEVLNLIMRGTSFDMKQLGSLSGSIGLVTFWPKKLWPSHYPGGGA